MVIVTMIPALGPPTRLLVALMLHLIYALLIICCLFPSKYFSFCP